MPIKHDEFTPRASDLEGHELTKHLENSPHFLEKTAAAHGGWENLPSYLRIRYEHLIGKATKKSLETT